MEIALNPTTHKTGDVWHVALPVEFARRDAPTPAPASVPRVGASDANAGLGHAPAVLYGFKVDGDATRGGWRFHPRLVVLDPRAECLVPPLGDFPDPETPRPPFLGSLADVMNGGGAQLAADALADRAAARAADPRAGICVRALRGGFHGTRELGPAPGRGGHVRRRRRQGGSHRRHGRHHGLVAPRAVQPATNDGRRVGLRARFAARDRSRVVLARSRRGDASDSRDGARVTRAGSGGAGARGGDALGRGVGRRPENALDPRRRRVQLLPDGSDGPPRGKTRRCPGPPRSTRRPW